MQSDKTHTSLVLALEAIVEMFGQLVHVHNTPCVWLPRSSYPHGCIHTSRNIFPTAAETPAETQAETPEFWRFVFEFWR